MGNAIKWPAVIAGAPYDDVVRQRFIAKVVTSGDCWVWTAAMTEFGYGLLGISGRTVRAHRLSYALHVADPAGLCVLHKCDNPACVRPEHLFAGTRADNNVDMVSKGRHVPGGTHGPGRYKRGVSHHACVLTPDTVDAIRGARLDGASYSELARAFGICTAHAWRICNGRARVNG